MSYEIQLILEHPGWKCVSPLISGYVDFLFFFQSASCFSGFLTHGFSKPLIENSIFNSWLGICGCREPTVCTVTLLYTILDKGLDHGFWYLQGTWNQSPINTKDWLSSGGIKSYTQFFYCIWIGFSQPQHCSRSKDQLHFFFIGFWGACGWRISNLYITQHHHCLPSISPCLILNN